MSFFLRPISWDNFYGFAIASTVLKNHLPELNWTLVTLGLGADVPSPSSPSAKGAIFLAGGWAVSEVEDWAHFPVLLHALGGDLGAEEAVVDLAEDLGGIMNQ